MIENDVVDYISGIERRVDTLERYSGGGSSENVTVGLIIPYGASAIPDGWLECDGSAVSRTTYSDLFDVIGTTYGAGDGSTTFNLPSLKGRVVSGYDSTQTEFNTIGKTGGSKTHTLTTNEMPSHTHVQNQHRHSLTVSGADDNNHTGNGNITAANSDNNSATTKYVSYATATNQNTGGGAAHNNLQPYIALKYLIRFSADGGVGSGGSGGGTTDHSALSNLDYASAGHTGFASSTDLSNHTSNTSNPHSVTKAQVGLGSVTNNAQIPLSQKGSASGVAELDAGGKVPTSQLPAYVDDVLEYTDLASFPATGETGKIYVAKDTNKTYRWSGSAYVEISQGVTLGETSSTAYRGDRGKTAYDHSQLTSGNPHSVTKTDVGLSNVPNLDTTDAVNNEHTHANKSTLDDIEEAYTTAEQTKLSGIESGATADQTDAEIETAYNNQVPTVSQADAEAGTSTVRKGWTPERVKQAIDALSNSSLSTNDMRGFMGQCSTNNQSIGSGAWTKLTTAVATEDFDTDSWYDAPNGKFQPDEAGYYLVGGIFTLTNLGDGKKAIAGVYKNGSLYGLLGRGTVGGTDYAGFGGAMMVYLNGSSDYLEMYGYHNHGSNLNAGGMARYCHFWGMKMETGANHITVSDTAPSSPNTNDLWVDTT